jgi:integrase
VEALQRKLAGHEVRWVFHREGQPIGDFRKAWCTACRQAGLFGRLFHDFRRTAARNMIAAGVPEKVAMEITGHKSPSMLWRYNIINERQKRDAVRQTHQFRQTRTAGGGDV